MMPPHDLMRPLHLRRLSSAQVQARNALVQRVRDVPLQWVGQSWLLTIELCASSQVLGQDGLWHARCHWGGGDFELWVSEEGARDWLQALYPSLALPRLPDAFAEAVVQAAVDAVREAVEGLGRGGAHLEFLRPCGLLGLAAPAPQQSADPWQVMDLTLRSLSTAGADAAPPSLLRARVATDSLGLMLMAALVAGRAPARNALSMEAVPVRLQAQVGATWLTRRQLRDLGSGDLVLMEQVLVTPERELWLAHADWGLRVHWGDAGMTVLSQWAQGGFTMPDDLYAAAGEEAPHDLDELPLRLTFDLGEREITLGELRQLQVGQGIDLGVPLGGPVQLRVQGVLVARGDLIEVDGRLGVAIVSLHGSLPPPATDEDGDGPAHGPADEPQGHMRHFHHGEEHGDPDDDQPLDRADDRDADTSRAAELPTDA